MSLQLNRNKIVAHCNTAIGIILRTPGLFIIEYWWQHEKDKSLPKSINTQDFLTALVTNIALINGFLLLLLPLSFIRSLYIHLVCGALIISAHLLSYYYVNEQGISLLDVLAWSTIHSAIANQISLLAVHVVIAIVVSSLLQGPQKPLLPILACYSLPVIARLIDFPNESLHLLHNFSFAMVGLSVLRYVFNCLPSVFTQLKGAYCDLLEATESQGMSNVLVRLCSKLFVPTHFLLFWSILFILKLHETLLTSDNSVWYLDVLSAASEVCVSPLSLFSTSVVVAHLSHGVLFTIKLYLWGTNGHAHHRTAHLYHPQMHTGWEEGMTTFLLGILTGLIEMKKQSARLAVLIIILFVVLSSLLQSMLVIAEPVILSLSAHHGRNVFHHIKVLLLCTFLFLFPLRVTWLLSQLFPVDFWMAVVLSTCLLTSLQVIDLVIVHCLLWYDASRSEPWESLDETVYYVKGFTSSVEFLVAFSVVIVGIWEGITGQWIWTNALILIVHCYFNVWQRFKSGFRSYLRRREAVKKVSSLVSASVEQLEQHNDLCAICFTKMVNYNSSIITDCHHFYHKACIRKWLAFQDKCPLCSADIQFIK